MPAGRRGARGRGSGLAGIGGGARPYPELAGDQHPVAGRHVLADHRVGADEDVVADRDLADQLGAGADEDPVAQGGHLAQPAGAGSAERNLVHQGILSAQPRPLADHDAVAVADREARADGGAGRDLDSGQELAQPAEKRPEKRNPPRLEEVGEPIEENRLKAVVEEQRLEQEDGVGPVAGLAQPFDVLAQVGEHVGQG